jgi:hypothetical protein
MVLRLPIHEWAARLAELRRREQEVREDRAWLLEIRIRILRYLLSRYGEGETNAEAPGPTRRALAAPRTAPDPYAHEWDGEPAGRATVYPFRGVEYPPRPREEIAPILGDLARRNLVSRIARGADPGPDEAWSWWRATWCAPVAPRPRA